MKIAAGRLSPVDNLDDSAGEGAERFPRFKTKMPYQVAILARLVQIDFMGRIAEAGIAPAQAYLLAELWMEEPLSQVELARRLDIGKATIGQTLNRLERAGLIERRRGSADRRVIMVHLTEAGRQLREPVRVAADAQLSSLLEILGEEDFAHLSAILLRATTKLRAGLPKDVD